MPRKDWPMTAPNVVFNGHFPQHMRSVLDVGCGLSVKSQYIEGVTHIVALDVYRPYLEQARRQAFRDDVIYINGDAQRLDALFLPNQFDLVLLQDVIEHFDKVVALKIIRDAEIISRRAVVITTPEGYFPQDVDTWGFGGDDYQTHRSGWSVDELEILGYHVQRRPYRVAEVQRTKDNQPYNPNIVMLDAIKAVL